MEKGKKKLSTHEHIELLKNLRNFFNNQEIRKMLDMYNKQRLKRIKKEGKFIELYNVLSEEEYEKYLKQITKIDMKMEANDIAFAKKENIKKKAEKASWVFIAGIVLFLGLANDTLNLGFTSLIEENKKEYNNVIEQYDKKIEEYALKVKELNLTDFQIVMKVMDDMWSSIKGYGEPTEDIIGFQRLDFLEDDGVGVCRNMADDFTAKLNAINPEFHARNMVVYMKDAKYEFCNIERKILNENQNSSDSNENQNNLFYDFYLNLKGNHMVVLFDMTGENVTMVADPTNLSLGVYTQGEIYMFSFPDEECYFGPKFGQVVTGMKGRFDCNTTKLYSYYTSCNIYEMIGKYGIEAENKALDEIHNIEENIKLKKYDEMGK